MIRGLAGLAALLAVASATGAEGSRSAISGKRITGDFSPSWSRDGKSIAFYRSAVVEAQSGVYVIRLGSHGRARWLGAGVEPEWRPGVRIVFTRPFAAGVECPQAFLFACTQTEVLTMRPDGGDVRRLTLTEESEFAPAWSPDRARIVFSRAHAIRQGGPFAVDLFVINADGTGERQLTTDPEPDLGASWSPDGRHIVFSRGSREVDLFRVNADGSGERRLTSTPVAEYDPVWSPNGKRIAFTASSNRAPYVATMNADGSGRRLLRVGHQPAWSPAGRLLVYSRARAEPSAQRFWWELAVMNADGSKPRRLVRPPVPR